MDVKAQMKMNGVLGSAGGWSPREILFGSLDGFAGIGPGGSARLGGDQLAYSGVEGAVVAVCQNTFCHSRLCAQRMQKALGK